MHQALAGHRGPEVGGKGRLRCILRQSRTKDLAIITNSQCVMGCRHGPNSPSYVFLSRTCKKHNTGLIGSGLPEHGMGGLARSLIRSMAAKSMKAG